MINLTVVIDNDEAVKKLRELQNVAKTTTSSVVKDSERMDASWQQMKNSLMSLTAGVSFAALAKQVVQVRGEVQQLEVAFETMLGSKQKADTLMTEIIDLAAKTPFGLQDVSNATKMLLAYGSTAEQVADEIKMLGNIASGLSIPLNDMIYLYGTTRTQGRMFTQDLRQFMGRGIPLAEELAKKFGVTKDKVDELVTAGKVGFDEMAKALQAMTSEGGKFNNLMDKQSQTIAGQISNLEDAIYQMFNEIGQSSEGVISELISGASWVVEHYKEILDVLKYVIAAYGSYKAAVILVAAGHKAMALAAFAGRLLNVGKAVKSLTQAMRVLNVVTKANPIGILASVLMTVATACFTFGKRTEETAKQMGELEKATYDEYIEVNRLVGRLQDANLEEGERSKLLAQLKTIAPNIVEGLREEANMTAQLTANLKDYNAEQIKKIQLASLDDKMQAEMKKVADAKIKAAEAQINWSDIVADYQAKKIAGGTPRIDIDSRINQNGLYVKPRGKQKENIEETVIAAIDKILSDTNTTDAYKALEIEKYLDYNKKVGRAEVKLSGIGGFDIEGAIKSLNQSAEGVRKAEGAFKEFVEEDKQLRRVIGDISENDKKEATEIPSLAKTYAELEKAYNDAYDKLAEIDNNRSKYTAQQRKEAKDALDAAEKAFKEVGGVPRNKTEKDEEKQKKLAKERKELLVKLENDATKARIDAMSDGLKKTLAQIEYSYEREMQEIAKEEAELKGGETGPNIKLKKEEEAKLIAIKQAAEDKKNKAIADAYREEFSVMQDFLKEYGTFHQRKLAIAEDYAKKIAKADTEEQKKTLKAQRDANVAAISAAELSSSINWELIFSDFGSMFREYIRPEFEALGEYMKTDEFKNAPVSDKQTIVETYKRLDALFNGESSSFKKLGISIEALQLAQAKLKNKQEEYASMYAKLIQAQDDYTKALESGDIARIASAEANLNLYKKLTENAKEGEDNASEEVSKAQETAANTANLLAKAFNDTAQGLASLKSASIGTIIPALQDTVKGLSEFDGKLGDAAGKVFETLSKKFTGVLSFVFKIIDILKDGISGLVTPILDAVFNAVSGIIGDILNFKDGFFRKLGESLYKGILGIFRSILTLGGWFDWWNDGDSDKTLSKDIERLSEVNAALQRSIDHLTETMTYSTDQYKQQVDLLKQAQANTSEMMQRSVKAYSKGFLGVGGSHSSAYHINEGVSDSEWERISNILNKDVRSSADFFALSAEEMLTVATKLPDLWGKIKDLANDGYQDAAKYMDEFIEYGEQLNELEKERKEFLTNTSFDEFRNHFKSVLSDMEMSSEEFANSFNQMLVDAMVEALMVEKYDDAIETLYNQWADAMEDGMVTDDERKALEEGKQDLYNRMAEDRKFLDEFGDSSLSSQQTHSKGFQTMSQETGSELNGRFTDIQGQTHRIADAVEFCKSLHLENLTQVQSINATVAMIHNDTSLIAQHTKALANIDANLDALRRSVDNGII